MARLPEFVRAPAVLDVLPSLAQNWWVFLVRGLVAFAFGLVGLFWPEATLVAFILFYGLFAVIDGVFEASATSRKARSARGRSPPRKAAAPML